MYRTPPEKKLVKVTIELSVQQVVNALAKYVRESPEFDDNIPSTVNVHIYGGGRYPGNRNTCATIVYEAERPKNDE